MTTEEFSAEATSMRPTLLGIARSLLDNEQEAEDAVQEAMLRMWQLHDASIHNRKGMARVVVRNLCLDKLRQKHRVVDISSQDLTDQSDEDAVTHQQIERMMQMVRQLPTIQQTVLQLRHMQDMSMTEIAQLLGTTEVAVRQSLSRARRAIAAKYHQETNQSEI